MVKNLDMADFSAGAAWIDGDIVPIAEARIPILDWGFTRSDATYDVVHTWDGKFFRLDDHLARFWRGVETLRYQLPIDDAEVRGILQQLVDVSDLSNAYVALIATRGSPMPGSRDPRDCRNQFYAFAIPFVWIANPEKQKTGLQMAISDRERIRPEAVDPTVKNYHWLDFQVALLEAYDAGAETVVLLDSAGNICEGPGFNVFVIKSGTLATPDRGALEGITRQTVIDICKANDIPVSVRPVSVLELKDAEEIIITSTAGGVMPITQVDDAPVGNGVPGKMFTRIHRAYWDMHSEISD